MVNKRENYMLTQMKAEKKGENMKNQKKAS